MENNIKAKIQNKTIEVESYHSLYNHDNLYSRELKIIDRDGRIITNHDGKKFIDFINCSYLGLEVDPYVIAGAMKIMNKWGVYYSASRLRTRIEELDMLDKSLQALFADYNIVTFSNLKSCHSGVLPLLATGQVPTVNWKREPVFLVDTTAHSTLQQTRDSLAHFGNLVRLDFSDLNAVEDVIRKISFSGNTVFLICDGVGSMGGLVDVKNIVNLIERYGGFMYIDDAHGVSSIGLNGQGYVLDQLNYLKHEQVILSGSLSKGFGAFGGFVGFYNDEASSYIKRNCSSYTFSGPLPVPSIGAALASCELHVTNQIADKQLKLSENIEYFDSLFTDININENRFKKSPIRTINIGDAASTVSTGYKIFQSGISCNVAIYPVVPKNSGILRFAFSSLHTKKQIDLIYNAIKNSLHLGG